MKKNAFEIRLTSNPSSKDLNVSRVINESWLIQESLGLEPDWFEEIKLFSIRNLNISLNIVSQVFFYELEAMRVRLFGNFSNIAYDLLYCLFSILSKRACVNALLKDKLRRFNNFGNNILVWNFQLLYVGLLVEVAISSGTVSFLPFRQLS